MKRYSLIIIALFSISLLGYAQRHSPIAAYNSDINRISIGLRGGAGVHYNTSNDTKMNFVISYGGNLDIQYSKYKRDNRKNYYGFLTGVSVGFQQTGFTQDSLVKEFKNTETDCGVIDYSITAQGVKETKQQLNLEIPLMFALRTKGGFFFNIGPRLSTPIVWNKSTVNIDTMSIVAHFQKENVDVVDEEITGKANKEDYSSYQVAKSTPLFTLKLGVELGYEWTISKKSSIGLGAYIDWSALSIYADKDDWIAITSPTNSIEPQAKVSLSSPTKLLGQANAGIKLSFNFNL